ncbi:MAG: rRNA maturation RNase YbeY [Opitutaceae bacterium]|nr:rRNA maturation RNase YbeY [Opitutaceae bacterium]
MPVEPTAPREVAIACHHPRLRLDRRAVKRVIHVLDAEFPIAAAGRRKPKFPAPPPGELSLVFLTDAALAQLHADFLADPTITDVITFEGNPALGTTGEICVSADAALRHVGPPLAGAPRRSMARRLTPAVQLKFARELTLYLVHGWLHLAGYDDLVPAKKRAMRRAEARAMELLRCHRSLPRFTFRP